MTAAGHTQTIDMPPLTLEEKRQLVFDYFGTGKSGVTSCRCPAALTPPPVDAWDETRWHLYAPDASGGWIVDDRFLDRARAHEGRRGFVYPVLGVGYVGLLVLLFTSGIAQAIGEVFTALLSTVAILALWYALSRLFYWPIRRRLRDRTYVRFPPSVTRKIDEIQAALQPREGRVAVVSKAFGTAAGLAGGAVGSKAVEKIAEITAEKMVEGAAQAGTSDHESQVIARALDGDWPDDDPPQPDGHAAAAGGAGAV